MKFVIHILLIVTLAACKTLPLPPDATVFVEVKFLDRPELIEQCTGIGAISTQACVVPPTIWMKSREGYEDVKLMLLTYRFYDLDGVSDVCHSGACFVDGVLHTADYSFENRHKMALLGDACAEAFAINIAFNDAEYLGHECMHLINPAREEHRMTAKWSRLSSTLNAILGD